MNQNLADELALDDGGRPAIIAAALRFRKSYHLSLIIPR